MALAKRAKKVPRTKIPAKRARKAIKNPAPPPATPLVGTREQWYPLASDPGLHAAGVEIGARATFQGDKPPKMRIVFRAGSKEAEVECVHVVVYAGPLESMPPEEDLARTSELHPIILAPEEHFFALNSYVGGIAEVGLRVLFAAAREAWTFPVGFNALMQKQVLNALSKVIPEAILDFCLWMIEDAGEAGKVVIKPIEKLVAGNNNTPPEILMRLAGDKNKYVRLEVAYNKSSPPEALASLAVDSDESVRVAVAKHTNTPSEILALLAKSENRNVRNTVAANSSTPMGTLMLLVKDKDREIRNNSIQNENWVNISPEMLACLTKSKNKFLRYLAARYKHGQILKNLSTALNTPNISPCFHNEMLGSSPRIEKKTIKEGSQDYYYTATIPIEAEDDERLRFYHITLQIQVHKNSTESFEQLVFETNGLKCIIRDLRDFSEIWGGTVPKTPESRLLLLKSFMEGVSLIGFLPAIIAVMEPISDTREGEQLLLSEELAHQMCHALRRIDFPIESEVPYFDGGSCHFCGEGISSREQRVFFDERWQEIGYLEKYQKGFRVCMDCAEKYHCNICGIYTLEGFMECELCKRKICGTVDNDCESSSIYLNEFCDECKGTGVFSSHCKNCPLKGGWYRFICPVCGWDGVKKILGSQWIDIARNLLENSLLSVPDDAEILPPYFFEAYRPEILKNKEIFVKIMGELRESGNEEMAIWLGKFLKDRLPLDEEERKERLKRRFTPPFKLNKE